MMCLGDTSNIDRHSFIYQVNTDGCNKSFTDCAFQLRLHIAIKQVLCSSRVMEAFRGRWSVAFSSSDECQRCGDIVPEVRRVQHVESLQIERP